MTAATTTPVLRDPSKSSRFPQMILTSGQKVMQGWAAAIVYSTGKLVNMTAGLSPSNYGYYGTFTDAYDGSSTAPGGAGDVPCVVDLGYDAQLLGFLNDTGSPVALANIGSVCYFLDNQTVTMTSTGIPAGIARELDSSGRVMVEKIHVVTTAQGENIDITSAAFTSNAWSPTGASLVSGTTYVVNAASGLTANATINLPTSGVANGAKVVFKSDGTQGAYTVTFKVSTVTQFTALAASIHWTVEATNLGNATTSNWAYLVFSAAV